MTRAQASCAGLTRSSGPRISSPRAASRVLRSPTDRQAVIPAAKQRDLSQATRFPSFTASYAGLIHCRVPSENPLPVFRSAVAHFCTGRKRALPVAIREEADSS
jgi:hypothetical protein